jgi:hypothetical protein
MIRTKQPQVISGRNRLNAVVYIDVKGPDATATDIVTFNMGFHILLTSYETVIEMRPNGEVNEEGNPIMVSTEVTYAKPYLKLVDNEVAKYKKSTYYGAVGNPSYTDFDQVMISQIEYVNSRTWTGNELQQVYFWNLTASDLEVVSEAELAALLTPYEVTI